MTLFVQLYLCAWLGVELAATRCMSEEQVWRREVNYGRHAASVKDEPRGPGTCAEALLASREERMNHRSVSPWTYRLDQDAERFPSVIPFAECLCQGCIVGRKEDFSYISVQIFTRLKVLKKRRCSTDVSKYSVTTEVISVPVGCTCVRPKVKRL